MEKIHYLRHDYRKEILELIVSGFQVSINELHKRIDQIEWYDGGWFVEEIEPILGLTYIACQNYINSSIYDKFENIDNKWALYKNGSKLINGKRTEIELIIAVANYYKHRDDSGTLHKGTNTVLKDLELEYINIIEPEKLPIIKGVDLLSDSLNLKDITKKVTDWRESLWANT